MTDRYRYALETVAQWDEWAAQRLRELDAPPQATAEGLPLIPHPDMPHEYHAVCRICGEPGYINLTLVAGDEAVQVVKRDDR